MYKVINNVKIQKGIMKKRFFQFLAVVVILGMNPEQSKAQVYVTGHAYAEIIEALEAVETSQLNFGSFAPVADGGSIVITPEGTRSWMGLAVLSKGTHNAASFNVTGENNATFSISLPVAPVILTNTSNAKTMTVTDWVSDPPQGNGAGILEQGSKTINVGATLIVGSIQDNPKGIYTGTYTITFDYN